MLIPCCSRINWIFSRLKGLQVFDLRSRDSVAEIANDN